MSLSPEEIQNLSDLFLSKDEDNTRIAFELMENQLFDPALITELFVVYKLTDVEEFKAKARKLLEEHGSGALKAAMNSKKSITTEGISGASEKKIKANIKKYVSSNELDGLKFAKALYNRYDFGISYLLDELPSEERKTLLETFKNGTSFSLTKKDLTKMPKEFYEFTDLEEINLSGNKLASIPSQFTKFKNLKKLIINDNNLKKLHPKLANLSIETLNIAENLFETFPETIISMKSLKVLDLNEATKLSVSDPFDVPSGFQDLPNIVELTMSDKLYNGVVRGHSYAGYPNFATIKSEDGKPLNLDGLNLAKLAYQKNKDCLSFLLSHASDEYLTKDILPNYYDKASQTFDFLEIELEHLPKALANFEVKHLILRKCGMRSEYIENIGLLKNLETLDMSECYFTNIEVLMQLTQLRILNLSESQVNELPQSITNLINLEELNLKRSSPQKKIEIPEGFEKLTKLKKLTLAKLSFVDEGDKTHDAHIANIRAMLPNCVVELKH